MIDEAAKIELKNMVKKMKKDGVLDDVKEDDKLFRVAYEAYTLGYVACAKDVKSLVMYHEL